MRAIFAIPGDLNLRTGANGYNRRIIGHMPKNGIEMQHLQLPAGLPLGTEADFRSAGELLAAVSPDVPLLIDSLGFSSLPLSEIRRIRAPLLVLVHHPLALESGLSAEQASALHKSEADALGLAQAIIVSSPYTAKILARDFSVAAAKITVAEPGTERAPRAVRGDGKTVALLAVGSLIPRKGYDVLLDALKNLSGLDWHLTIAGGAQLDPAHAAHIRQRVVNEGFANRIEMKGELPSEGLEKLYAEADIFVMPSLFEGYGMVLGEAMIRGLPVLCTTGGAAAETVPDDAGLKVPPGDASAFAAALKRLILSAELRGNLAQKSWAHGQSLPSWADSAQKIASLVKGANFAC